MNALQFLVDHGASVLFLVVFVEQVGLPIPAIPLLVAAGALVGAGKMSLVTALLVPIAASLPPDLARAVEQAAKAEGTTFSAWLAQTAAHRLKLEAGRQAIAEWERENGPLTEAELADGLARARSSLGRAPAPAAERRSA